jgi:hypothetical protein
LLHFLMMGFGGHTHGGETSPEISSTPTEDK